MPRVAGPGPAVISDGAGRPFLGIRSCECVGLRREKSLFSCTSHLKPTISGVTIPARGAHLPRLFHGKQIGRPLPRRNQQSFSPRRPTQRKNPSRLHKKVQRYQPRLLPTPSHPPLAYLPSKHNPQNAATP